MDPDRMTFKDFHCPLCRRLVLSLETPLAPDRQEAFMFNAKHAGGTGRVTLEVWTVAAGSNPARQVFTSHTCPAANPPV